MSFFEANTIYKTYQGQDIIADISITVERGELVSLLGVSGVGKTTLFHVLSGLEAPDSGHVYLEDEEITARPGKLSYMQQKDLLLPFKRIIDNVSLPLILQGVASDEARRRAEELLPAFGLEGSGDKYPAQLSGGMRQRAALLRSFLFSSRMLLLDEPFSALDAITKMAMHAWFRRMRQELQLTALLISHDVDEAIRLSDRIYIMAGRPGRITAELRCTIAEDGDAEISLNPEFIALKREILALIR